MGSKELIFAQPRTVSSVKDCYFYHSMDIPDHGEVTGEWDLRGREKEYLGNIDLKGKTVLEIGTASGHLCFWMEREGAKVTAYDLSDSDEWDIVPYSNFDFTDYVQKGKEHVRRINNSWWYAHERFQSKARVAYGTVYNLPPELGHFEVVTLGAILLHLRDPFLAIQRAAGLAVDTLIVTDVPLSAREQTIAEMFEMERVIQFLPDAQTRSPWETWWRLSPEFVVEVLRILGFGNIAYSRHQQCYKGQEFYLYTIVGRKGSPPENQYTKERRDPSEEETSSLHHELMWAIPGRRLINHVGQRVLRRLGFRH